MNWFTSILLIWPSPGSPGTRALRSVDPTRGVTGTEPPVASSTWPVTQRASSDATNATTSAALGRRSDAVECRGRGGHGIGTRR